MQTRSSPAFLRRFALALVVMASAVFAATEAFDPFGENDWLPWSGPARFATRVLTAGAFLRRMETGSYALVFGTSRSAMISAEATGEPTLNLYPIYGNPKAVLAFLNRLDGPRAGHVREIVYLLDRHTFCRDCEIEEVDYTAFWPVLWYKLRHFPEAASRLPIDLIRTLQRLGGRTQTMAMEDGALLNRTPEASGGGWTAQPLPPYLVRPFDDETLAILGEIDALARRKGWAITYFTPPLPDATLARIDAGALAAEKRRFLGVVPAYHDLTRIEGLSDDPTNFVDATHLNPKGARRALCAMREGRFVVRRDQADRLDPTLGRPESPPPLSVECRGGAGP